MNTLFKKYSFGLSHKIMSQIVTTIVTHVRPKKIIIYGSRARGDFKRTSDIDIAIECDDDTNETGILNEILNEDIPTLLKCEIINLEKVETKLKDEVIREGIVVYEKT